MMKSDNYLQKQKETINIQRYDVILVDLDGHIGSEQKNKRPCVVVSNDKCNQYSPVLLVVPFTSKAKTKLPTHCVIKSGNGTGLSTDSLLIGEQPTPIDRSRILEKLGHINNKSDRHKIDIACFNAFFYGNKSMETNTELVNEFNFSLGY